MKASNAMSRRPVTTVHTKKKIAKRVGKEAYEACLCASKNINDECALKVCIEKSTDAAKFICEDDSY